MRQIEHFLAIDNVAGSILRKYTPNRGPALPLLASHSQIALAITVAVARQWPRGYLVSGDLTAQFGLAGRTLEPHIVALRRGKVIRGRRGPRGGYRLARKPEAITCADVLSAIEAYQPSPYGPVVEKLIMTIEAEFMARLRSTTIAMLLDNPDLLPG